jgi:hypothetical protein
MTQMAGGILLHVAMLELASFLVREHAAGAMHCPCLNAGNRLRIVSVGGVPGFVALMVSSSVESQERSL